MPFERVMGPNRNNIENYGDLQPIAGNVKPRLLALEKIDQNHTKTKLEM